MRNTWALGGGLLIVGSIAVCGQAFAQPFGLMFERDNDVASNELGFNTYATYADILTANATSSTFSNINVNAPFSTTGIYFVGDDQGDQQVPGPTPILLMSPVLAGLVFRRVRSQKGSG